MINKIFVCGIMTPKPEEHFCTMGPTDNRDRMFRINCANQCLSPQQRITDRSKTVLKLWFSLLLASGVSFGAVFTIDQFKVKLR